MGRRGVRRRVIVATIVVGALAATAVVVRQLWLTDTARVVDADEAVHRFRAADTVEDTAADTVAGSVVVAPTTTAPQRFTTAPLGVYRYSTTGHERIDVLGGTQHDYPGETTITVTTAGCGVRLRWDLLHERYEEYRLCATPTGIELATTGAFYHEFFQHGSREEMACDRTAVVVPAAPGVGAVVPMRCTLSGKPWAPQWQVLDRTLLHVAGVDVLATHVRMTVEDDDEYWEHTVTDWWFDPHGLPVRMTSAKESKSSSGLVGDVVYQETFTAELESFTPLR